MDGTLREFLDLALRWLHLIAGIMWVGNSMLFNWLDRNLVPAERPREQHGAILDGEIWMVHSGGFYQIEKKQLPPGGMPKMMHWFKWQSYITWMSGFALLFVVYYGGGAFLVDPAVSKISHETGAAIGLGTLAGGFTLYDLLWRSPIAKKAESVAIALSFAMLGAAVFALCHTLAGRAAYIHVGAMMGTIMAGNVFFHIIPSQRELVKLTEEGKLQDNKLGKRAKQRSIHNNYLTFPVLFLMVSNHFPSTYGSTINYLILATLIVTGATIRHIMNVRFTFKPWIPALAGTMVAGSVLLFLLISRGNNAAAATTVDSGEPVTFTSVQLVLQQRCLPCHSANPTDREIKAPPSGIMFDSVDQISMFRERIKARAVITKTMPQGNKTGMTPEERELLARWFMQGAKVTH